MSRVTFEPLDLDEGSGHVGLLHSWVTHPRSVYWQMLDATPSDVADEYARIASTPGHEAHLGRVDGAPAFLVETYDPQVSPLAGVDDLADLLRPGDLGMHVLVAPPSGDPVPGFTRDVMAAVVRLCFARPDVLRVVVEPDVGNTRIAVLNAAAGFEVLREVELPGKRAAFSACSRAAFAKSDLARRQECPA